MAASDEMLEDLTKIESVGRVESGGCVESQRRVLGVGKMAQQLKLEPGNRWGKWCSSCKGIWFGWLFEVECPSCGNRRG